MFIIIKAMYNKVTQKVKINGKLGEGFDTFYNNNVRFPFSRFSNGRPLAVSPARRMRRCKICADVPAARRAVPDAPDARICTDRSRVCLTSACPRPDVPDAPDARICTDGQCPRPDVSDAPDAPDCGLSGVYPC